VHITVTVFVIIANSKFEGNANFFDETRVM